MPDLTSQQRKLLDDACVKGRSASEQAVRAALGTLAVTAERPPGHLGEEDRQLRRGLRARSRQLGEEGDELELLIVECAYEQWHRLLFARFLAENDLLIHQEYRAPVTLEDCDDLAESLGEPDGWSVAGRFAADILPGIFRVDDPCVRLRLAPEGRLALEGIVASLPDEVFRGDDALGWVYQYWQREKKDDVNRAERKIGGADIGPVTQLFTESYMVRFLLENSLGAWWAARYPDSRLVKTFDYLRVDANGLPAAGGFDGWPDRVAHVTVMDPCCGSGHFLVEAFSMLWQMRAEEEGISVVEAQDAVLRDNLFGLELDPRCVQIAMFGIALHAWKSSGGWRQLPTPNIACSGIPVRAPVEEWKALARGDQRLENALVRLHVLFRDADSLGSLIDPVRAAEVTDPTGLQVSTEDVEWAVVSPVLQQVASDRTDPAADVLGADAAGIARVADYLSRRYALVVTNPPFLGRGAQSELLRDFSSRLYSHARDDLATVFLLRCLEMAADGGGCALVTPQAWLFMHRYAQFREDLLRRYRWRHIAQLGEGAFLSTQAAGALTALVGIERSSPGSAVYITMDVSSLPGPAAKANGLANEPVVERAQSSALASSEHLVTSQGESRVMLGDVATSWQGLVTGDVARFILNFWEVPDRGATWKPFVTAPAVTAPYSGRDSYLRWEGGAGALVASPNAHNFNPEKALGKRGVLVASMRVLRVALYDGEMFNDKSVPIIPADESLLPALWAYCSSPDFTTEVRRINQQVNVGSGYFLRIPFDIERWQAVADEMGPLPQPWSDDPTQWLFEGRPEVSTAPLQVAVARLLGYRWPAQPESDDLDALVDADVIVCLPSVRGERTAGERVQELLARSFGGTWSPARTRELLKASGSAKSDLDSWLRDDYFKAHCQTFLNRPFIWHVWDGRKDGFSALVNYHRLDRPTLEKLAYSYLGDWIERQTAAVRDDVAGAEERLASARALQRKLELVLAGEPPFDIYVRWKALADQPIGWDPDVNDGVRQNVRPFVSAGVLRSKFNVKWEKDRGKNPDGSERLNDLHHTNAQKLSARGGSA